MSRTIVICRGSGSDGRRWLSASMIAGRLPRDRFDVRSPEPFDAAGLDQPGRAWLLVDSDDVTGCALIPEGKRRGVATALVVADPTRPLRSPASDAFLVEGAWSADYLRKVHGIDARIIPPRSVRPRPRLDRREGRFATFVDPIPANGVDLFARLADELGRRRPDIPLLVVEGSGTEADLVARGIDLRVHGNVQVMARPAEAAQIWSVTRLVIAPLLDPWAGGHLVDASELDLPLLVGDRPPLREILGRRSTFVTLPGWMTPCSRRLPAPGEVEPWVDAVIRGWDDDETSGPRANRGWAGVEPDASRSPDGASDLLDALRLPDPVRSDASAARGDWAVLVPFLNTIEPECEGALHALEQAGVRVVRCRGCSAIDQARSVLASEAVKRGSRSLLFIDSDIAFDPTDALRLFARPEPVVVGVYPKKNARVLTGVFAPEIPSVTFGAESPGLYPLQYAAAGFLRIHVEVLRRMIEELALPLCNEHEGGGFWPFFLPLVLRRGDGSHHYLAEDWAFSHRLEQIGITPLADTTIRLFHLGMRGYTWEDSMKAPDRYESFTFTFSAPS